MNEQILYGRPSFPAQLDLSHPLTRGLVGAWCLNENDSTSMRAWDSSPYKNHGLVAGAVGNYQGRTFASGNNIKILNTDSTALNFTTSDFTLIVWFKATNITGSPALLSRGSFNVSGYYWRIMSDGSFEFSINQSGARQTTNTAAGSVLTNTTYQGAFVRSGTSGKLYINGIDSTSGGGVISNPDSSNDHFYFGMYSDGTSWPFIGLYAEGIAFNRALSAQDTKQLYLNPYDIFLH